MINETEMLDVAIWKLICNTHGVTINKDERKEIVMKEIEKSIKKMVIKSRNSTI